jgi:hypothetical protein
MGLDVRLEPYGRPPETVLFGWAHGHELPPPRQQRTEFVGLDIRQGAAGRTDGLGKMGQRPRIEGSRLRQLPSGFGKISGLARIDHRDGQLGSGQRGDHGSLVSPSGFKHNEGGLDGLESRDKGGDPFIIVRHGPALTRGAEGYIELGFGHINTNKKLRGRHDNTPH